MKVKFKFNFFGWKNKKSILTSKSIIIDSKYGNIEDDFIRKISKKIKRKGNYDQVVITTWSLSQL